MEQAVLQKWEYHIEVLPNDREMTETFAQLGEDGWELVSVTGGNSGDAGGPVKTLRRKNEPYRAFFKRPAYGP